MADNDKRLLELPDINYSDDLYFMTEKSGSVTSKIQADKVKLKVDTSLATAGKAADAKATGDAINAEAAARQQAISSEVTDRNSAISAAIGTEVTNRNAAIAVETENRQAAYQDLNNRKAEIDGYYDELSVGNADQLIPSAMETESVPYNFRTAGGSLDIGDREFDKLVGLSLPWNQLVQNGNFAENSKWGGRYSDTTISNGIATTTPNTEGTQRGITQSDDYGSPTHLNHKYFITADVKSPITGTVGLSFNGAYEKRVDVVADTWKKCQAIWNSEVETDNGRVACYIIQNLTTSQSIQYKNINAIDLTQLFGSTIADYIYSLETATAGAGVAWFKKFFPKQYYAYNSGEIESVKVSSHDMVGFNQWDEEWEVGSFNTSTGELIRNSDKQIRSKNYIPVLPNVPYHLTIPSPTYIWVAFYDADGNMLDKAITSGSNWLNSSYKCIAFANNSNNIIFAEPCAFIKFYTANDYGGVYKNDICIHLKWDGARDGEYEPYKNNSYALDPIELRGILKLDSNNEPYADGDTYEADGTVTRYFGEYVFTGSELCETREYHGYNRFDFTNVLPVNAKYAPTELGVCSNGYFVGVNPVGMNDKDKTIGFYRKGLYIRDDSIASASAMTTYLTNLYNAGTPLTLVYELETPTTESADPFTDPQTVDNWGTEQYVDKAYTDGDRDVEIPVGHETKYPVNLRDKLETAPNAPTSDGDYIVQSASGQLTYIALGSTTTIQNIIARLDALEGGGE